MKSEYVRISSVRMGYLTQRRESSSGRLLCPFPASPAGAVPVTPSAEGRTTWQCGRAGGSEPGLCSSAWSWGSLEPGRAETGARERLGRAVGAEPSTLRAGSTFSCFHLDERLHSAESLERKEKPLTPCSWQ